MVKLAGLAVAVAIVLGPMPGRVDAQEATRTNRVSNLSGVAETQDTNLRNPWAIANVPGGALWVCDAESGLITLYTGAGDIVPLVVTAAFAAGRTIGSP